MPEREDIIWLAGLLEGEGCFHQGNPRCNTVQISIALSMTDQDVVARAAKIMNAPSISKVTRKRPGREHYKDDYICVITNDRAYVMMNELLPFMGNRRTAKIKELLHAYATRTTRAEANRRQASRRKRCPQTASLF